MTRAKIGRPRKAPDTMSLYAFRLPADLVAVLDVSARELGRFTPWAQVTRSDALRVSLIPLVEGVAPVS